MKLIPDNSEEMKEVQSHLKTLGFYNAAVDGIQGVNTTAALKAFQQKYLVHGNADTLTLDALKYHASNYKPSPKQAPYIESFLDSSQYYLQDSIKKQICLHHTAGNGNAYATKDWWNRSPEKVATHFIIGADGTTLLVMPFNAWAWHLGVGMSNLDMGCIGIEICSYGWLSKKGGYFYNAYGSIVPADKVATLSKPYKGFIYFEKYTDAQIKALENLLKFLIAEFKIPLNKADFHTESNGIFDYPVKAMAGQGGIFTHNSYLRDKIDIYPDDRILALLKSL